MSKIDKIFWFCLVAAVMLLPSCVFDPQPEPDPIRDEDPDNKDEGSGQDHGGDGESDDTSDLDDGASGDDGTGQDSGPTNSYEARPIEGLVYCSAPGDNGLVAIVGVPGAAGSLGKTVNVRGSGDQAVLLEVAADGSFAGRIEAEAGELLSITSNTEQGESEPIEIMTGVNEDVDFTAEFLGTEGEVIGPDMGQVVEIFGEGQTLRSGTMVIGGNTTMSAGRSTLVSCAETCRFNLFIEGRAGDEIDLFIVPSDGQTGLTEYQTIIVLN